MKRLIVWMFVLLLGLAALAGSYWRWGLPNVESLRRENPKATRLMELRRAEAKRRGRRYSPRWNWTPLSQMSPHLVHAVLTAEDAGFYQHRGIDWPAMRASLKTNLRRRRYAHGGSTITQQVAKNLYLSPHKSLVRKAREMLIARKLETVLPKRRILEIYLNIAEWGEGIFGAEAAARAYFGKSAAELSPQEAASLAAILPSPRRHAPGDGSRFSEKRTAWVLKWMERVGYLNAGVDADTVAPPDVPEKAEEEPLLEEPIDVGESAAEESASDLNSPGDAPAEDSSLEAPAGTVETVPAMAPDEQPGEETGPMNGSFETEVSTAGRKSAPAAVQEGQE